MQPFFVIDFDSTFVTIETLEHLAAVALARQKNRESVLRRIRHITRLGMEGVIPFEDSLSQRIKLFKAHRCDVAQFVSELKDAITPSVKRNRAFFKKFHKYIYIISGGFIDYIYPIVKTYGIEATHILANRFSYDQQGNIIGYDRSNPLSRAGGKTLMLRRLGLGDKIYIIGDGYTDYEIKKAGVAHRFYAFVENISREKVVQKADRVIGSFDELLSIVSEPLLQCELTYDENP